MPPLFWNAHRHRLQTGVFKFEKLTHIAELWDEISWLPKRSVFITYPNPGSIDIHSKKFHICENSLILDWSLLNWVKEKYLIRYWRSGFSWRVGDGNIIAIGHTVLWATDHRLQRLMN